MADFGKAGQSRRSKLLKQQPVADNMLDVVGHHCQHRAREEKPEASVVKRGEGYFVGLFLHACLSLRQATRHRRTHDSRSVPLLLRESRIWNAVFLSMDSFVYRNFSRPF